MDSLYQISNIILLIPLLILSFAIIQSLLEKEKRASGRLAVVMLVWAGLLFSLILFDYSFIPYISIILAAVLVITFLIIVFPFPERDWRWPRGIPDRIDERNIMFSRAELIPGTKRFNDYYSDFPEHKAPDDRFRKMPGLLKEGSTYYNPFLFGSADAAFYTVESLHARTDGEPRQGKKTINPVKLTGYIKKWAIQMGCHSIGITELKPHHLYHTGGRKGNYGEKILNDHKYAIAFTVEMDYDRIRYAPRGPIVMESSVQYLRSGSIAVQIAAFIRNMGYPARAHIDGKYQVRCTEIARDAGLGELGRMSLLMTPGLGPRVRLAVVTTDIPLETDPPKRDPSLLRFCSICRKCAYSCPSSAISFNDPGHAGGTRQWVINQEACYSYWCKIGTDCGRCISVCPYSHPNTLMHNSVRRLIRISPLFRLLSLKMDNWLYGRKPIERRLPQWMNPD